MTTFWVSLGMTLLLTAALLPALQRAGLADVPNDRSSHSVPTPRGGGIAIVFSLTAAGALSGAGGLVWLPIVPAILLGAVGLADDFRSLPSSFRLLAQGAVALMLCVVLAQAVELPTVAPAVFVTAAPVGVVAYVNAFNFMDGVNGISALNSVVIGGWFMWLGHDYDIGAIVVTGASLAGAALGFLPFNAASRVFLGDVGSYALGALISSGTALAWASGAPLPLALAPLCVYFADTGWVIMKRAHSRASLTQAHRDHVYQRLVRGGWSHLASAGWSATVSLLCCATLALLYDDAPVPAALAVALLLLGYLISPRLASTEVSPEDA